MNQEHLSTKESIDIMLQEYKSLRKQTLNSITILQSTAVLMLTAAGVLIGLIYSSGAHEIFLVFPPFLVTFFAEETRVWQGMLQVGRYLSIVEKRINTKAGDRLLIWESSASPARNWASLGLISRTINPDLVLTTLFFCVMIVVYAWTLYEGIAYILTSVSNWPSHVVIAVCYAIVNGFLAVIVAYQRFIRLDRFLGEYERQLERSLLNE